MKNLMIICICVVCLFCASNGDCKTDLEKLRESTALRIADIEQIVLIQGVQIAILMKYTLVHEWQIKQVRYMAMLADKNTSKEKYTEVLILASECDDKIEQYRKECEKLWAKNEKLMKEANQHK